ncbi:MAG TPA: endolytic transglycosylase MltG [Acidobacteriota bacterium]|nr:endolytic transglycosylase MltG [Acidobacteriota bacterium]
MARRILNAALLLAVALLAAATMLFVREYDAAPAGPAGKVLFEIAPGQSVRAIARNLRSEGIVRRPWAFLVGCRIFHAGRTLKAGEYEITLPIAVRDLLGKLLGGKVFLRPITVPEGLTAGEVDDLFRAAAFPIKGSFAEAAADPGPVASWDARAPDLEGYLFPDTYRFAKDTPASVVAATMAARFGKAFDGAEARRAAELRMSVREVVTLASLIEKETAVAEERPLISAVFHNRLRIGMKLDCDPTVIYALKRVGLWRGRLLLNDLKYPSPYNTYISPGLPPGPICSPGEGSLRAALRPAAGEYLYFVADADGRHAFSRSYREHLTAVRRYRAKTG